ncbi:phage tail protein [Achromobacter sp. Root83]|nr:hypothetical protein [Achromobacter sp. Root83]KRC86388.1 phage tail protein [Achromobacter sp. Root83]
MTVQKIVYQADFNGLYLCPVTANELALAPGVFNIPYGAYEEAPPAPIAGKCPRRVGNAWVMVADFRTTPLWMVETGAQYTLGELAYGGDGEASYPGWGDLPPWLTDVPPAPADDLET